MSSAVFLPGSPGTAFQSFTLDPKQMYASPGYKRQHNVAASSSFAPLVTPVAAASATASSSPLDVDHISLSTASFALDEEATPLAAATLRQADTSYYVDQLDPWSDAVWAVQPSVNNQPTSVSVLPISNLYRNLHNKVSPPAPSTPVHQCSTYYAYPDYTAMQEAHTLTHNTATPTQTAITMSALPMATTSYPPGMGMGGHSNTHLLQPGFLLPPPTRTGRRVINAGPVFGGLIPQNTEQMRRQAFDAIEEKALALNGTSTYLAKRVSEEDIAWVRQGVQMKADFDGHRLSETECDQFNREIFSLHRTYKLDAALMTYPERLRFEALLGKFERWPQALAVMTKMLIAPRFTTVFFQVGDLLKSQQGFDYYDALDALELELTHLKKEEQFEQAIEAAAILKKQNDDLVTAYKCLQDQYAQNIEAYKTLEERYNKHVNAYSLLWLQEKQRTIQAKQVQSNVAAEHEEEIILAISVSSQGNKCGLRAKFVEQHGYRDALPAQCTEAEAQQLLGAASRVVACEQNISKRKYRLKHGRSILAVPSREQVVHSIQCRQFADAACSDASARSEDARHDVLHQEDQLDTLSLIVSTSSMIVSETSAAGVSENQDSGFNSASITNEDIIGNVSTCPAATTMIANVNATSPCASRMNVFTEAVIPAGQARIVFQRGKFAVKPTPSMTASEAMIYTTEVVASIAAQSISTSASDSLLLASKTTAPVNTGFIAGLWLKWLRSASCIAM